jgi:hypothetical protein
VSVLIALADVGPGVQLEEGLTQAGIDARWDAARADGPTGSAEAGVVVIDADHLGTRLGAVADAWRDQPSLPGVIAIGASKEARELAPRARVTLLAPSAQLSTVAEAIREAEKLRLASNLKWPLLRAAVGLPPIEETPDEWQPTLVAARAIDVEIPRAALRWHARDYVTPTTKLDDLRNDRVLTVPELATLANVDGTRTVQTIVKAGPLDPSQIARLLWALASMGAVELSPDVHDLATPQRRALDEIRAHIHARAARIDRSTYYDVLEITPLAERPEIDAAYRLVAWRFSPKALSRYDLGDVAGNVASMWDLVDKARATLCDHAARGRYHDWLRSHAGSLQTRWAIEQADARGAMEAFARGQRALGGGDVHKAMSDLATACRLHPGHPDYEANLAWARYRVQVASGRNQIEAATAERRAVESLLLGCRPWARALVALSLLCIAAGDAEAARWHIRTALTVDPGVPAAAQLAMRLGIQVKARTPGA